MNLTEPTPMRAAILLLLLAFHPLAAHATEKVQTVDETPAADATWRELLARAAREKKPLVIFFRTPDCARCREFERLSVPHPTIARRLPAVLFAVLPAHAGEAAKRWASDQPGVAFFDRTGTLRARWPIVPDTTNLGIIIDSASEVAPQFERAAQLIESGAIHEGELEAATALARMGRITDARATLARVRAGAGATTRQAAIVLLAILDANEGRPTKALAELRKVVATPATPEIAADAARAIAAIERGATVALTAEERGVIRILPLAQQVVSGRHIVRTHVASAAVAQVAFSLDGRQIGRIERPPFSQAIDFGALPERHSIRAVAFDRRGRELGGDERVVNEAGETFWLRLVSPREAFAAGRVRVSMNVRVPSARRVQRVVVSWNDAERATLTAGPWEATIDIPEGQMGVLRAVAELDDGRTSEDAVLLNAGGMVGHANVQLVEVPVTVASSKGVVPEFRPESFNVREGAAVRRVESIATAAETPLTVGLLIDVSDSMQATLPDVQEAAIRFLETMLGPRDRAFLISFDTEARLLQPATSDRALLRRQIMSMRPNGLTALHDAMVLGLLQFEGIQGRRAMILFSDGVDRTSRYRAGDVRDLARRVNVPIHVIASLPGVPAALDGDAAPSAMQPADAPNEELPRIAAATGGTSHTLDHLAQLVTAYDRIEAALRNQVLLVFRTEPATRENEWRAITVEAGAQNIEVYAPEGYYASW